MDGLAVRSLTLTEFVNGFLKIVPLRKRVLLEREDIEDVYISYRRQCHGNKPKTKHLSYSLFHDAFTRTQVLKEAKKKKKKKKPSRSKRTVIKVIPPSHGAGDGGEAVASKYRARKSDSEPAPARDQWWKSRHELQGRPRDVLHLHGLLSTLHGAYNPWLFRSSEP